MRWYAIPVLAIASLLFACGGGSDEADIRKAMEGYLSAFNRGDFSEAYAFLSMDCRDEVSFESFEAFLTRSQASLREDEPKLQDLRIVEVANDTAIVDPDIVIVSDGEEMELGGEDDVLTELVKEDGRWRLRDCAAFGVEEDFGEVPPEPAPAGDRPSAGAVAEADDDPSLPGEYVNLPEIYGGFYGNPDGANTATHVRRDVDYVAESNSNPPAGGPHWGSAACGIDPEEAPPFCGPAQWGIYRKAWQPETLVHNMEHAGVVLWYNTADQTIIDELENLIADRLRNGQLLVMAPYPDMEDETVALTAWSRIDKYPVSEYTRERVEEFIDVHERRFNPEDF